MELRINRVRINRSRPVIEINIRRNGFSPSSFMYSDERRMGPLFTRCIHFLSSCIQEHREYIHRSCYGTLLCIFCHLLVCYEKRFNVCTYQIFLSALPHKNNNRIFKNILWYIWVQTLKVITFCSTRMLSVHCKNVQTSNYLLQCAFYIPPYIGPQTAAIELCRKYLFHFPYLSKFLL